MKQSYISISSVILLLAVFLLSCRSQSKEIVSENVKSEYNESGRTNINQSEESKKGNTAITLFDISDEFELIKVEFDYDTSLPYDSISESYPLKKKTETNLTKKSKDKSVKSESVIEKNKSTVAIVDATNAAFKLNAKSFSENENKTDSEINIVLRWIGIFAISILGVVSVLYIVRKQAGKIL